MSSWTAARAEIGRACFFCYFVDLELLNPKVLLRLAQLVGQSTGEAALNGP